MDVLLLALVRYFLLFHNLSWLFTAKLSDAKLRFSLFWVVVVVVVWLIQNWYRLKRVIVVSWRSSRRFVSCFIIIIIIIIIIIVPRALLSSVYCAAVRPTCTAVSGSGGMSACCTAAGWFVRCSRKDCRVSWVWISRLLLRCFHVWMT